ncbi:MAG: ATP-binding protein [Dissulfurispiraceae bacterium]
MYEAYNLFAITFCYLILLFVIAYYAEKKEKTGKSIVNNPYIYSLSLAVYCTSWTFYGSVGKAAASGLSFLPVYLGPTLIAALWVIILKRIVRIAKINGITTISDFISSRYGKSLFLNALVTFIAVAGIAPYLALQFKAIISTFEIISGKTTAGITVGLIVTLFLGMFAIIFGARRLDFSERHSGLVFAIAFESIIKLISFVIVGIFVTYGLFADFGDILSRIRASGYSDLLSLGAGADTSYYEWSAILFLSMMAIMFLPRQFHMAVVENYDEAHITKAAWLFPLYLLMINIFVIPIAFGGLLLGGATKEADYFVLTLPLHRGAKYLSLLAFIGGFSAASSMVIVESLALSTMVMNSIIMPPLIRFREDPRFPIIILNVKRLIILGIVLLGYLCTYLIGEYYSLVDMGLNSFEAVTLFAPALLLGLYWKGGNKKGAIVGLIAGFAILSYTLIVPALIRAGILQNEGIISYMITSEIFNPNSLFGIKGLAKWGHALFWSMLFNLGLYVAISLFTTRSKEEEIQSLIFVESYEKVKGIGPGGSDTYDYVEDILAQYLGRQQARDVLEDFLLQKKKKKDELSLKDLWELRDEAEKVLSGAIGSSMSTIIFENKFVLTEKEREDLSDSVKQITQSLRLSRHELALANRELSYLQEFTENIIESTPVGIITIDSQLKVKYWNKEMVTLVGIEKQSASEKSILTLLPWIPEDFIKPNEQRYIICKTPDYKSFKIYISPFKDPSGGYVVILEDITEQQRLERERKNILSMFAHDMKNPVMTAGGFLSRLRSGKGSSLSEMQQECLAVIADELTKLEELVRDFLEFSRFEAKTCKPVLAIFNLDISLAKLIDAEKIEADKKNITIFYEKEPEQASFIVNADSAMINRVLTNLVDNAIKYTNSGGRITIRLSERKNDVLVHVIDTGVGISEDHIPYIFDAFYRVSRDTKGSGLGLSISKTIIEAHGGRIWVSSTQGQGSIFNVTLPKE